MAYFPLSDGTVLFNSNLSVTGPNTSINTTGYNSISVEVASNNALSAITIEGSSDTLDWFPLLLNNDTELTPIDVIIGSGLYSFPVTSLYIRVNVLEISGVQPVIIVGRSSAGREVQPVAAAFNPDTPLFTSVQGLAKDANNALILTDNKTVQLQGIVGSVFLIDCTGYNSFVVQSTTLAGNITGSDDGITWSAISGINRAITTAYVTAVTAGGSFFFPALTRYVRVTLTTTGLGILTLKQQQWQSGYLSSLPVTASGTVGISAAQTIIPVGGTAAGSAIAANAAAIAGIDGANLVRTLKTDTQGRIQVAGIGINPAGNSTVNAVAIGATLTSFQNSPTLNVQDLTQLEGQTNIELLAQILLELRIANQQRYEQFQNIANDPPESYRNDPTIFAQ